MTLLLIFVVVVIGNTCDLKRSVWWLWYLWIEPTWARSRFEKIHTMKLYWKKSSETKIMKIFFRNRLHFGLACDSFLFFFSYSLQWWGFWCGLVGYTTNMFSHFLYSITVCVKRFHIYLISCLLINRCIMVKCY